MEKKGNPLTPAGHFAPLNSAKQPLAELSESELDEVVGGVPYHTYREPPTNPFLYRPNYNPPTTKTAL